MEDPKILDELNELFEAAIYKEIASQASYEAGQQKTNDLGARALLMELAQEELKHIQFLRALQDSDWTSEKWDRKSVADLKISEHLTGIDKLEGAGLQDTLIFAMKREQQAVDFYSQMSSALKSEQAKIICERLAQEELKHKYKLEVFYDDLVYREN